MNDKIDKILGEEVRKIVVSGHENAGSFLHEVCNVVSRLHNGSKLYNLIEEYEISPKCAQNDLEVHKWIIKTLKIAEEKTKCVY